MEMGNMSSSSSSSSAAAAVEKETLPLLGVGPAIGSTEAAATSAARRASRSRRHCCGWGWLPRHWFARDNTQQATTRTRAVCKPMTEGEFIRHRANRQKVLEQGHFQRLAANRKLVDKCLHYYNSRHPLDEYEPAPGEVTDITRRHSVGFLTHGNFVARRKRSSFLIPTAPRTLFFFEMICCGQYNGVVTCVPLLDEPVTEAYSILGFPIWWGKRRDGRSDCICKTCHRRFNKANQPPACGHGETERICEICHHRSAVLHPLPGEFTYNTFTTANTEY